MSDEAERALQHAVRLRVVARYVGELGLVLGVATLLPAFGAIVLGEARLGLPYALIALLLAGLGLVARRGTPPRELQGNEALVIGAGVFVLSPLVLAGPLALQGVPWIDACFESISGITTTGLSTLGSIDGRPRTFLFARAWMQWIGGLGFVVLSLAVTLEPGIVTRQLGASGLDPDRVVGSLRMHARRVLYVYLALTGFGIASLLLIGAGAFDAVLHTFAGVSTGGFAPRDTNLAALAVPLQTGVLGLSLLGAVSLPLYAGLRRGRWQPLRDDVETRALLVAIALTAALVIGATRLERASDDGPPLRDLALVAVSAQTTAGFSTFDVAELPATGRALLILSMLVGGSHGSTAGGIKLMRFLLVLRLAQWLIARTRLPAHAVSAPSFSGERLESPDLLRASTLILLFLGVVFLSWLSFLAYDYAPLDALFEVASAMGTVGLSSGISRPGLEPLLKGVLCLDMLFGRLEVFALLVALSPRTWIGRRAP